MIGLSITNRDSYASFLADTVKSVMKPNYSDQLYFPPQFFQSWLCLDWAIRLMN